MLSEVEDQKIGQHERPSNLHWCKIMITINIVSSRFRHNKKNGASKAKMLISGFSTSPDKVMQTTFKHKHSER